MRDNDPILYVTLGALAFVSHKFDRSRWETGSTDQGLTVCSIRVAGLSHGCPLIVWMLALLLTCSLFGMCLPWEDAVHDLSNCLRPKDEQKKELQKELDARRDLVRGGVADWVQGAKF